MKGVKVRNAFLHTRLPASINEPVPRLPRYPRSDKNIKKSKLAHKVRRQIESYKYTSNRKPHKHSNPSSYIISTFSFPSHPALDFSFSFEQSFRVCIFQAWAFFTYCREVYINSRTVAGCGVLLTFHSFALGVGRPSTVQASLLALPAFISVHGCLTHGWWCRVWYYRARGNR